MSKWKYISENTHNYLSLHDCWCNSFKIVNDKIVMKMEWMEILSSHPNNPYSNSHQSTEGIIEFINISNVKFEKINFENKQLEILDFNSIEIDDGFQIHINAIIRSIDNEKNDFFCIDFNCKGSIVMFNELREESWFENS